MLTLLACSCLGYNGDFLRIHIKSNFFYLSLLSITLSIFSVIYFSISFSIVFSMKAGRHIGLEHLGRFSNLLPGFGIQMTLRPKYAYCQFDFDKSEESFSFCPVQSGLSCSIFHLYPLNRIDIHV